MKTIANPFRKLLLVICSLFWLNAAQAQHDNILILYDAFAAPSSTLVILVEIVNDYPFSGYQFDIPLPEDFTYVTGSATNNSARHPYGLCVAFMVDDTNILRVIGFHFVNSPWSGNEGIVMSFALNTPGQPGSCILAPENVTFALGMPFPPSEIINAHVSVLEEGKVIAGDANCNGIVNVQDVVITVSYILENNSQSFCFANVDMNWNGSINVLDVTEIINLILNPYVCETTPLYDIDGNEYTSVFTGNQCWMRENLKTTQYRNGTPIEHPGSDNSIWQTNTTGAYALYDNDTIWKNYYGALYNWYAVNNTNKLCPAGWHLASDVDWNILALSVDTNAYLSVVGNQSSIAGGKMKSARTEPEPHPRWNSPNTGASNASGFTGLPGGFRDSYGMFNFMGSHGNWWSSSHHYTDSAWLRTMNYDNSNLNRFHAGKSEGFSVRCIKNYEPQGMLPVLNTAAILKFSAKSATSGGNVIFSGGFQISARGIVWDTIPWPTLENHLGVTFDGMGDGEFTSYATNLSLNTSYYLRAYATNSLGTAYGNLLQITTKNVIIPCPDTPTVTDIDNNIYTTVMYDEKCWMAENLKTTRYRNGVEISYPGSNNTAWQNNTNGAYAWFDNDNAWKDSYGAMYNGLSVNNPNGLCPEGWHVPTNDEFTLLTDFAGGWPSRTAKHLRSCRQVNSPLGGDCTTTEHPRWDSLAAYYGTDDIYFSALPGGYRMPNGTYRFMGAYGYWWSSTPGSSSSAYAMRIYGFTRAVQSYESLRSGYSIRCVRDY